MAELMAEVVAPNSPGCGPVDQRNASNHMHLTRIHPSHELLAPAFTLPKGPCMPEQVMQLAGSGVKGFITNISNYGSTREEASYAATLRTALATAGHPDMSFIIDTSRNAGGQDTSSQKTWCNAKGAGMGYPPTADTYIAHADAFLWVKPPGESDGTSNANEPRFDPECKKRASMKDAPQAGEWFHDAFVMLATNAKPPLTDAPTYVTAEALAVAAAPTEKALPAASTSEYAASADYSYGVPAEYAAALAYDAAVEQKPAENVAPRERASSAEYAIPTHAMPTEHAATTEHAGLAEPAASSALSSPSQTALSAQDLFTRQREQFFAAWLSSPPPASQPKRHKHAHPPRPPPRLVDNTAGVDAPLAEDNGLTPSAIFGVFGVSVLALVILYQRFSDGDQVSYLLAKRRPRHHRHRHRVARARDNRRHQELDESETDG